MILYSSESCVMVYNIYIPLTSCLCFWCSQPRTIRRSAREDMVGTEQRKNSSSVPIRHDFPWPKLLSSKGLRVQLDILSPQKQKKTHSVSFFKVFTENGLATTLDGHSHTTELTVFLHSQGRIMSYHHLWWWWIHFSWWYIPLGCPNVSNFCLYCLSWSQFYYNFYFFRASGFSLPKTCISLHAFLGLFGS